MTGTAEEIRYEMISLTPLYWIVTDSEGSTEDGGDLKELLEKRPAVEAVGVFVDRHGDRRRFTFECPSSLSGALGFEKGHWYGVAIPDHIVAFSVRCKSRIVLFVPTHLWQSFRHPQK